jgi:hypothetical protein
LLTFYWPYGHDYAVGIAAHYAIAGAFHSLKRPRSERRTGTGGGISEQNYATSH